MRFTSSLSPAPFLGELAREMGGMGSMGFRQKRDIVSAARRSQEDRFLASKRYGVVSKGDQCCPNTKHNQISTKIILFDHDGTGISVVAFRGQ
jgi:hypothetical protein